MAYNIFLLKLFKINQQNTPQYQNPITRNKHNSVLFQSLIRKIKRIFILTINTHQFSIRFK